VREFGIDVVVIEPGAIKTKFADTATNTIASEADGPYAAFNVEVASKIKDAFEGRLAAFAGEPADVARAIERAVTSQKPRTRYPVTAAAHLLTRLRKVLPDRAFDAFLRSQYKPPQP
jgi:NAD(P)-dependent dehydrogenase (short-subunit alcohol dehydrogenase family)